MTTMTQELAAHPELVYRHTVDQYHDMIANGSIIEGEPFELLDGQIVRKIRSKSGEDLTTVGIEHALIVSRLGKLSSQLELHGCHMTNQQPITLPPRDEPEPDGVIARGTMEDYATHHPYASDVLCVVEVSDSSLVRDRGYKLQMYAVSSIPMYVIINLIDRKVEVYQHPAPLARKYERALRLSPGQSLDLPTAEDAFVSVPVAQMFR